MKDLPNIAMFAVRSDIEQLKNSGGLLEVIISNCAITIPFVTVTGAKTTMTLRAKIEEALRAAPNDPEQAALAVCLLLSDELNLEEPGWFDADDTPRTLRFRSAAHRQKAFDVCINHEVAALFGANVTEAERETSRADALERLTVLWSSTADVWETVAEHVARAVGMRLRAANQLGVDESAAAAFDACMKHEFFHIAMLRRVWTTAYEREVISTMVRALVIERSKRFWRLGAFSTQQIQPTGAGGAPESVTMPSAAPSRPAPSDQQTSPGQESASTDDLRGLLANQYELPAHRVACLQVLGEAILRARYALDQRRRDSAEAAYLYFLMDAVHNLPAALSGDPFWDKTRVLGQLRRFDAHSSPNSSDPFTRQHSLQTIYNQAFEGHASELSSDVLPLGEAGLTAAGVELDASAQ